MQNLISFSAGLLALSLASAAGATSIDFRNAAFTPVGDVNHLSQSYGGYSFDFDALRITDMQHEGTLFWDSLDGFGIKNSNNWDADEIEGSEVLKISFGQSLYVTSFTVADLFPETNLVEQGHYSTNGGATWGSFFADGAHLNGEVTVNVGGMADHLLFKSAGSTGFRQGHEFSVVAVNVGTARPASIDRNDGPAVPEPTSAMLFAAGALLVGRRSRRA